MSLHIIRNSILFSAIIYPIFGYSQQNSHTFEIPYNYNALSHKELVSLLNPTMNCEGVDFSMSRKRFIKQIELDNNKIFLATVCEPGAYQDQRITYLITKKENKAFAKPLGWLEPVFKDNEWKLAPTYTMAGPIKLDQESKNLINMRIYVSAWTCGFNAYYSLPLSDDKFIKPDRVEADNDCDNGVRYDGWPEIDINKMEILDKPEPLS